MYGTSLVIYIPYNLHRINNNIVSVVSQVKIHAAALNPVDYKKPDLLPLASLIIGKYRVIYSSKYVCMYVFIIYMCDLYYFLSSPGQFTVYNA